MKFKLLFLFSVTKNIWYNIYDINYSMIKGPILSLYMYNKFDCRDFNDIDILIPYSDIELLGNILNKNNFYPNINNRENFIFYQSFTHQLQPFVNTIATQNIEIDLNFDIFWGEYEGKRVDIEEFISDNVEIEIYGCKVKTLTPIKAMIQLILHHYKDMNSIFLLATRNSIQYNMFKDIYYLLKNNLNEITIERLYSLSTEYEIIPYVFYILYYTGKVFDDDILNKYIETFRTEEGEKLLNSYGLCESERKEWKYDFNTRLTTDNLYDLIKNDLTKKDNEKIAINKRVFLGEVE